MGLFFLLRLPLDCPIGPNVVCTNSQGFFFMVFFFYVRSQLGNKLGAFSVLIECCTRRQTFMM